VKRSPLLVTVVIGVAALAGCEAGPPSAAEGRDVVRPALHLAVDVPDGWTWTDLGGDVVLEMVPAADDEASPTPPTDDDAPGPATDAAAPGDAGADTDRPAARRHRERTHPVIHVAMVEREGLSLQDWAEQTVESSRELQPDLEVLTREPARLADGRHALRLVLKNPRGLEPFVQRMLLTVNDDRAYAVIATAPESAWPAFEAAASTCFDSLIVW
jgi:hypothetical protein